MLAAPFVLDYSRTAASANEAVLGVGIMGLSVWRLRTPGSRWASWVLAGAGLWLVFSPFIFGYRRTATYWNELLFGILLILLMFSSVSTSIRGHSHLAH
jgi:hypothetical protein